jgi:hypothetical protein
MINISRVLVSRKHGSPPIGATPRHVKRITTSFLAAPRVSNRKTGQVPGYDVALVMPRMHDHPNPLEISEKKPFKNAPVLTEHFHALTTLKHRFHDIRVSPAKAH